MSLFLTDAWKGQHPKLNGNLKWIAALLAAGASYGALQFQVFDNSSEIEKKVNQEVFETRIQGIEGKIDLLIDYLITPREER